MMNTSISIRSRRSWAAAVVVGLATVTLGGSTLTWNAAPSSAAPNTSALGDPASVSTRLEELHRLAMTRSQAEEDDKNESRTSWGHAVTPEQAVTVARRLAIANGLPVLHSRIELQTRNGRAVYAIRFGAVTLYVDAELGTPVP